MASVLLGTVTDDAQLDEFADQAMSADLCEQCAEAGYQLLQKKTMMLIVILTCLNAVCLKSLNCFHEKCRG